MKKVQTLYSEYQSAIPENRDGDFTAIKQLDEGEKLEKNLVELEELFGVIFVEKNDFDISKYKSVDGFQCINNQVVYIAEKDDNCYVAVIDGKESKKSYKAISDIQFINNQVVYIAEKDDERDVVVANGKESKKSYEDIFSLQSINNQIAYIAQKGYESNVSFVVVVNGKERESTNSYGRIFLLQSINNQVAYTARTSFNKRYVVVVMEKKVLNHIKLFRISNLSTTRSSVLL